jgi:F-type H+-transporting ATPase subunit a
MEMEKLLAQYMPYIVMVNFALVAVALITVGRTLASGQLTDGVPGTRQNIGEFVLDFFVNKARDMGETQVVKTVAPFLATCFLFILFSNVMGMLPIPLLNNPPTGYYSVPLGLALCAVGGTIAVSGALNGVVGAIKHLVWPNPLQLISEVTDVLSLSLRLFGNIGGEHMTLVLVMSAVPFGIPLILHVLGLIPAFVQALVFTLLTTSFVAGVIHKRHEAGEGDEATSGGPSAEKAQAKRMPTTEPAPVMASVAVERPSPTGSAVPA